MISKHVISIVLVGLLSTQFLGTTIPKEVNANIQSQEQGISGPIVPGTEDILAQDTVWKRNVTVRSGYNVLFSAILDGLCMGGAFNVVTKGAKDGLAAYITGKVLGTVNGNSGITHEDI